MKEMSYRDLTPELLKELAACATAEEIIRSCAAKELEISAENAATLFSRLQQARKLGEESLKKVAGGGRGYAGTQMPDDCPSDDCFLDIPCQDCWEDICYWVQCNENCWMYNCNSDSCMWVCWDSNGDGINECDKDWLRS